MTIPPRGKQFIRILGLFLLLLSCGSLIGCGTRTTGGSSTSPNPLEDRPFEEIVSIDNLSKKLERYVDAHYIDVPSSSLYSQRLRRLMEQHRKVEERRFDFDVYLSPEVEVLGLPNGAIRISSGVMDMFTDQELIWLLLQEQYHVMYGHARDSLVRAYKSLLGVQPEDQLTDQELQSLIREFASSQYSVPQVLAVDEASAQAMQRFAYNLDAAPSALFKLAVLGNNHTLTAKQPEAQKRAQKILVRNLMSDDHSSTPQQSLTDSVDTPTRQEGSMPPLEDELSVPQQPLFPAATPEPSIAVEIPPALIREQNWQLRTGWYIELQAFDDRVEAETLGETYRVQDMSHHIAKVEFNSKNVYLALLGPFFEYDVAKDVLEELRSSGKLQRSVRVLHVGH